jgi:hypothetical protein
MDEMKGFEALNSCFIYLGIISVYFSILEKIRKVNINQTKYYTK